jgi:NAD-dependent dihydropyrimidine dehydrogenase PreA subunit
MAYVITEACAGVKDKACVEVCPCDGIHEGRVEKDNLVYDQLFINRDHCIDCGLCEPECPVGAIFADTDIPAKYSKYIKINAEFFADVSRTPSG